jgi:hypothetical protein
MGIMKYIIAVIFLLSIAFAQDTVYIASVGNNATITYKGTVKSIPLSLISSSKFTGVLQPTRVAIFNGATQIDDWVYNNYKFKVNTTAITNVDSFVPVVNRLNTASIKSLKLIQEIRVVSALPVSPDPTVTYLVGAQTSINITGLNGNADQLYQVEAYVYNTSTQDNPSIRFNSISTNVYDYRFSYVGQASSTAANATNLIPLSPTGTTNALSLFQITIYPQTGLNRSLQGQGSRLEANIQGVGTLSTFAGIWRDNSTNITSIQFVYPSITNGYGVGTIIRVFALRP